MSWKYHILRNGFTMVELVIVMLIIGILSTVVALQFGAQGKHSVTVQADQFRRDLSHLQLIAISQSKRLKLSTASGGYTVAVCTSSACGATTALTDPATGAAFSVTLSDGVALAPVGSTLANLDFDSLGRPQSGGSLVTVTQTYRFSVTGRLVDVSVLPITGFAQTGP
jgi:MSHA pilin protein MshC